MSLSEFLTFGAGTEKVLCLRSAGGPTNLSGAVTGFPNSVSGGATFSESSSLTRPVYVSDPDTDGKGAAWLVDTGDRGLVSTFTPASAFTVGIVFKLRSGTATDDDDYRNVCTASDTADFNPMFFNIGSNNIRIFDGTNDLDGQFTFVNDVIYSCIFTKTGTTFDIYVNEVLTRNATGVDNVPDSLCWMSGNNGGGNGYTPCFGATTYAMVEFDKVVNATEAAALSRLLLKEAAYGTQEANFPLIQAINTTADTTGSSVTVNMPTGIVAGNLLLVFVAHDTSATITQSGGSDWTIITNTANGTAVQAAIFAKIAAGSDTLTITDGADNQDTACIAISISNHGVTNVATITTGTAATGADTSPNPPDCNPGVTKNYMWLEFFAADDDDNAQVYHSSTSNFFPVSQVKSAASTSSCLAAVGYKCSTASSLNPGVMIMAATEEWVAQTLAIPVANTNNSTFFGINF